MKKGGNMKIEDIAEKLNILGDYLGVRDISSLTPEALYEKYGVPKADVLVLFGGSILQGGDEMGKAIENDIASSYIIVGGEGHTTETLRRRMNEEYPGIETAGLSEAECYERYISSLYGVKADYLETKSTNCGNNITYLLSLLEKKNIPHRSIILMQDSTMQRRMDAGMRKYAAEDTLIINYSSYRAHVVSTLRDLIFLHPVHGMWSMERYINLLMGEIPRLRDDANGYGPNGRNFIAHVDIPSCVEEAFAALCAVYGDDVRTANEMYSSK